MEQKKDEAAIPEEIAADESAQIASSSDLAPDRSDAAGQDDERPDVLASDLPNGPQDGEPSSDSDPVSTRADEQDDDVAGSDPVEIRSDTDSPESPTVPDTGSESESSRKTRRILPARSSSIGRDAAAWSTRAPWSDLRKLGVAVTVAWVLLLLGVLATLALNNSRMISSTFYLLAIVVAGIFPVLELVRELRRVRIPVPLAPLIVVLVAIIIGSWRDAAFLLTCYTTLLALRTMIVVRSEEPIQALAAARVSQAILVGSDAPVPVKEITVGDLIRIGNGEIVPLDGIVVSGSTTVDQSIVTGSIEPVEKQPGNDLYAGSRNLGDEIELRVARRPSQRTIARIGKLARHALTHPSRAQQMLASIVNPYTIALLIASTLVFLVLLFFGDHPWRDALARTAAFLLAASPAALLLTIGISWRTAMANGLRNGVLFRGHDELEILGTVETIAFDKTGTLTRAKPTVTGVVNCDTGWTDDEILIRAASAELRSEHRLGNAIVESARARGLTIPAPFESTPSPGKGIVATVDDQLVAVGNANLFAELGVNIWRATEISSELRDEGRSAVLVGDRENIRGVIGVYDPLRTEAPVVIGELMSLGIRRAVMLTGDDELVADVIAEEAGLHEVYADLLPEEKLGVVRQMEQGGPVGVIAGAGENSPTLALASSGIALGSATADVTREPAGVLLFGGELSELPFALWLAQLARRLTRSGLALLIGVMAFLTTGVLVAGLPLWAVILIWFGVTLVLLLIALYTLQVQRRLPRRRTTAEGRFDTDSTIVPTVFPTPRYVIDDDDDDEDDDDL